MARAGRKPGPGADGVWAGGGDSSVGLGRPRCEWLPSRANLRTHAMSTVCQANCEGQRAPMTGATSGIGRSVARRGAAAASSASAARPAVSGSSAGRHAPRRRRRSEGMTCLAGPPSTARAGARQRDRARTRPTPHALGPGVRHGARRNDADAPRLSTRGGRRGDRVPRVPRASYITGRPSPPTADAERSGRRIITKYPGARFR